MPIVRSMDAPPAWCELERFEIANLSAGGVARRTRSAPRERVIGTLGTVQLVHARGSLLLKEGQYFDVEWAQDPGYELKACTPEAQCVRLSGHWGDDLAGCGVFRARDEDNPSDGGDPVDYRKTTRIDSHYHDCDEYWILLEGRATVVVGGAAMDMGPGDCVTIGMGHHHDMAHAPEPVKAVFFETTLQGRKRIGHLWNHTHGPAVPHPERV